MIITIDIDALRKYMLDNSYAAFFVGDFGGALAEAVDIENASDEELIEMAERQGIDLRRFQIQMDRSRRNENMFIVKRHIPMNRACGERGSVE